MNSKFRALMLALATVSSIAFAQSPGSTHAHDAGGGSKQMHDSMMGGMKGMQAMKMSGDVDKDFAMMMRQHHEGALKMAQVELDKGKDPRMQDMARKIIEAQKKEIAEFDDWLKGRK